MKIQNVVGIGCFAKPAKLSRVFKKMLKNYTLGRFEEFQLINGHDADGAMLLKALIAGEPGSSPWPHSASGHVLEKKKVIGFFLTLRNQRLSLSIFAKGDHTGREKYTTSLEALSSLRQKRLN